MPRTSHYRLPRKALAGVVTGVLASSAVAAALAGTAVNGSFGFNPIGGSADTSTWNPAAPFVLPEGFRQYVVSDETDLNIYGPGGIYPVSDGDGDDWPDMTTVNETGPHKGRYLYRTHEVRGLNGTTVPGTVGGVVSVVDLETGEARILVGPDTVNDYQALDGLRWTPWGTLLFAEEVSGGRLIEIVLDKNDPMTATAVIDRPAVGRLAHEGIDVGPDGSLYVIDENRGGAIFRFVPDAPGNLASGKLYALKVTGTDGVGQGQWVGPLDPANARAAAAAAGAFGYQRPEDIEVIGKKLYVAVTEGPVVGGVEAYDGRVIAIDLKTLKVTNFVKPNVNVPVEIGAQTGFDNPDNLAEAPNGDLVIIEDNVPSDIWWARPDEDGDGDSDEVLLFASLTDPGAEGTGIYWGKDNKTLFVNIQHSAAPNGDGTWAITNRKK